MNFNIIDLGNLETADIDLANRAYDLFRETYVPILTLAGETLSPETFWRAQKLMLLTKDAQIIGFFLSSLINFKQRDIEGIKYLTTASESFRRHYKEHLKNVMTVEWVTVDPALRGRFSRVQYVDILMGLAFNTMRDTGFDCAMGFSRMDLKADKVVELFGGYPVETTVRHDIPCALMIMEAGLLVPHPIERTRAAIETIYNEATKEWKTA